MHPKNFFHHFSSHIYSILLLFFVALLFFPPILKAFCYFCPLFLSTGLVLFAVYVFVLERQVRGRPSDVNMCDDTRIRICEDGGWEGCFVVDVVDNEEVFGELCEDVEVAVIGESTCVLVEEQAVEHQNCWCCEEEKVRFDEVDHLAEGVWDCYFGMYSRWYHR